MAFAIEYLADPATLASKVDAEPGDQKVTSTLRRVSDRFRGAVHHPVHLVNDDLVFLSGDGGPALKVPATPIVGTPTVTVNGAEVTDFQIGRAAGLLRRPHGWPDGLENVAVEYSHGYPMIPADIQDAVLEMAEIAYTLKYGVDTIASSGDSVRFIQALAAGGTTPAWQDAVAKYYRGPENWT